MNIRSLNSRHVFDAYAYCRDDNGGRPWLRTFDTLNLAAAWMIQHVDQIRALNDRHRLEPEQWPALRPPSSGETHSENAAASVADVGGAAYRYQRLVPPLVE